MRVHARPSVAPSVSVSLDELRASVGSDDFYAKVAQLDPAHAAKWRDMVQVQKRFKDAEPGYRLEADRTYSESNRETLHRIVIKLFERRTPHQNLYADFIRLHPALFKENGACALPLADEIKILSHTDRRFFSEANVLRLMHGVVADRRFLALVQEGANETRAARRQRGLPVTVSGYP